VVLVAEVVIRVLVALEHLGKATLGGLEPQALMALGVLVLVQLEEMVKVVLGVLALRLQFLEVLLLMQAAAVAAAIMLRALVV
jgi:hypothetical protein